MEALPLPSLPASEREAHIFWQRRLRHTRAVCRPRFFHTFVQAFSFFPFFFLLLSNYLSGTVVVHCRGLRGGVVMHSLGFGLDSLARTYPGELNFFREYLQ